MTVSKKVAIAIAMTFAATPAFAGDGAAAAEVLFSEGKKLAQDGNFAAACPKFEESQKLDPGMGTLYRLGDCYEHVGRTASAWAAFMEVAASTKTAGQQARADDARKRAEGLEPNLAKLSIKVATPDLPDLVVKRGDTVVGKAQWGSTLPVDPGDVVITASAPSKKPWRGNVVLQPRAVAEIDVPALEDAPITNDAQAGTPGSRDTTAQPKGLGAQRTIALAAGVAGIVGVGIGTAFGIISMGKKSDADGHCDAQNTCDPEGLSLRHDALNDGDIATIGFIAGGILLAAGVVLWVTAPSRSAPKTTGFVMPTRAGLSFPLELP